MKNDKKIIRRTIAFAAALSFTYFSYSAELSTMVSYADPDTPEGTTTTSSSAAVTTPQSAVSEAPVTSTEPKTSDSENDSSVTTTVTTETTTVTTTTEPKEEKTFYVSINGKLDSDDAKKAIKKLFSLNDNTIINSDNGNYNFTRTVNKTLTVKDLILSDTEYISVPRTNDPNPDYNADNTPNDHLLKIRNTDNAANSVTLDLCCIINNVRPKDNTWVYYDYSSKLLKENDNSFSIEGIIKHNGYYYVNRNDRVTIKSKSENGWYIGDSSEKIINTDKLSNNNDVYFNLNYNKSKDNFSKTINITPNEYKDYNENDYKTEIKKASFDISIDNKSNEDVKVRIENTDSKDNPKEATVGNNQSDTINDIHWTDSSDFIFHIESQNHNPNIQYDITVKSNNNTPVPLYNDSNETKQELNFESDDLNSIKFNKDVIIEIVILPQKISSYIDLEDNPEGSKNIDIYIVNSHAQIPYYYKDDKTNSVYYLSRVNFKDNNHVDPDFINKYFNQIKNNTELINPFYTDIEFNQAKNISAINYIKLKSDNLSEKINVLGKKRNENCRTVFIDKMNRYNFLSIKTANKSSADSETSDTDSEEVKKDDYFVLYKTSNEKIVLEKFTDDFYTTSDPNEINKQKSEESDYLEIISVFLKDPNSEKITEENLTELSMSEENKLFYIDRKKPAIKNDSITIKQISNNSSANPDNSENKWFNDFVHLEFQANDCDESIKNDNHKTKINTLTNDCKEFSKITIYTNDKTPICIFEKNNTGNWSSNTVKNAPHLFSIASIIKNDTYYNFKINIEKELYINEDLYITVTDITGKESDKQKIHLNMDTKAPTVNKLDITDLNSIAEGQKACNSANSKSPKTLTAKINANDLYSPDNPSTDETTESKGELPGSGIKEAKVEYLYDTNPWDDNPYAKKFSLDGIQNGATSIKGNLNIDNDMENTSGIIRLTVTDNADNQTICYYKNENTFVKEEKNASEIILDFKKPVCELKADDKNAFNKKAGNEVQKWFRKYPEGITIGAYDEEVYKFSVSGLKSFDLKINGKNISVNVKDNNIDTDALKNNNYSLKFEDIDSDTFSVSLVNNTNASEKPITLFESISKPSDGKYEIELSAADYADNTVHNKKTYRFYIDDSKPSSDGTFSIEYTSGEGDPGVTDFGTFANKPVRIKIHAEDDKNSVPSSGLNRAVLIYTDENNKETKFDNIPVISDKKLEFTFEDIPKDKLDGFSSGAFSIVLYDNVENSAVISKLNNKKTGSTIVFDNKAPDIDITLPEEDTVILGDKMWSNHDVDVKFDISDKESGIASIDYEMNHNKDNTNTQITVGNPAYSEFKETESITLSTKNDDKKDGEFIFTINSKDNAGNKAEDKTVTIFKDITPPEIVNFDFSGAGSGEDHEDKSKYGPDIPYYHFSNSDDTKIVRVHAIDKNASSEINKIEIKLISSNGKEYDEEKFYLGKPDKAANDSYYNIEYDQYFLIPNDFKGIIAAKATDNVGNELEEWKVSYGYIDEIPDTHYNETDPYEIILPETEYHDANGNRLYNHDIDAVIKVKDTISGIRNIIVNYPDYSRNLETDLKNNNISDEWSLEQSDINLTTKVSTVINQTSNKNGNEITLTAFDNTGNEIRTSEPVVFSIDKTKPQIELSFDNNDADGKYSNYFKAGRTATIKIKERNFTPDNVSTSYPVSGTWTLISGPGTEGTDEAVYQNTVSFEKDGNYRLTVNCSDICGNEAENPRDSGEFTIDLTAPVINVSFDNNESQNTNYFNQKRTATIDIEELNFDPARVEITGSRNGSSENFPVTNGSSLNWNNVSGNTWRATIPLNDDGMYKFSISASDKAGNRSQTFNAEFNIDTVSPQVSFSGIQNQHAYNDEIRPVIEIDDNNIDFSTVSVTLTGARNKDTVQLEGTVEETGGKYRFTANDLPHTAEYDDIYTLTAKAEDLAGNPSSSEVKFSVNRFGSTFVPDANSVSLIGKTVKETGDIIINEINTDRHPADFAPTVRVIRNGSNSVLEENKDYSVRLSTDAETGWYEYQYTINSAVFSDDGVYEIMIYSEDSAENKNYSNSIMKFSVDKTRPSVNYLNIEQGGTYKADSKLVTALLNDNLEIDPDSVSVYVNSSQLSSSDFSYDSQTSEISFYIPNSNSTQYVEIMACDMAGNELDPVQAKIENLFVSTSSARILLHKTWFKIAAASAGILAFGSGLLLFLKKKKKS